MQLKFQTSEVCLQPHYMEQMNFLGDLIQKVVEIFTQYTTLDADDAATDQSGDGKRLLNGARARAPKLRNFE